MAKMVNNRKDNFDGYRYVTAEREDGNIHHLYKPVVKGAT